MGERTDEQIIADMYQRAWEFERRCAVIKEIYSLQPNHERIRLLSGTSGPADWVLARNKPL